MQVYHPQERFHAPHTITSNMITNSTEPTHAIHLHELMQRLLTKCDQSTTDLSLDFQGYTQKLSWYFVCEKCRYRSFYQHEITQHVEEKHGRNSHDPGTPPYREPGGTVNQTTGEANGEEETAAAKLGKLASDYEKERAQKDTTLHDMPADLRVKPDPDSASNSPDATEYEPIDARTSLPHSSIPRSSPNNALPLRGIAASRNLSVKPHGALKIGIRRLSSGSKANRRKSAKPARADTYQLHGHIFTDNKLISDNISGNQPINEHLSPQLSNHSSWSSHTDTSQPSTVVGHMSNGPLAVDQHSELASQPLFSIPMEIMDDLHVLPEQSTSLDLSTRSIPTMPPPPLLKRQGLTTTPSSPSISCKTCGVLAPAISLTKEQCFKCRNASKNLETPTKSASSNPNSNAVDKPLLHCSGAGCAFSTRSLMILSKHRSTHHPRLLGLTTGNKETQCEQCGYHASSAANLKRHVLSVHDLSKPFQCDFCDYAAKRKDHLKRHLICKHSERITEMDSNMM